MNISEIKILNYRGIKDDDLSCGNFSCIIGENNAGKSTILLATSLFFSGSKLYETDFYNPNEPITIQVTFSNIQEGDIARIHTDHRDRIRGIVADGKLELGRRYEVGEKPTEILCKRKVPKEERFDNNVIKAVLKGKKGTAIKAAMIGTFPEWNAAFDGVTTQKNAFAVIEDIINNLDEEYLESKFAPLPTGFGNSIKPFLPEVIYIAAVKDFKDDVKTKESTTFGKLLGILSKFIENSGNLKDILGSFDKLHGFLNKVEEDGRIIDNRISLLVEMETLISKFLQENFPKAVVELSIPKPEIKQIFSNAKILIDDGVKDAIDTKGDGIKRSVTFALLRTYVEQLKMQKKKEEQERTEVTDSGKLEPIDQPYLFLFEEPELYLHPGAQLVLFEALENLASNGNQVIATTHSPSFFSPNTTGSFVKVIKEYPADEKPYARLITIDLLKEIGIKDAFQIICYENNTAAFFSNKVLLVEGDSDLIYIKGVAKALNPDWNFDSKNIPIISINGKSNVKRFVDFFSKFDIRVFCLVDSDALIDGFEKFDTGAEIKLNRDALLKQMDEVAEKKSLVGDLNKNKIKELARRYTWREKYRKFKEYAGRVVKGEKLSADEMLEIDYLFSEEVNNVRRQIFTDEESLLEEKYQLQQKLMDKDIFILSKGAIEDYYPDGAYGVDKPTKALKAVEILNSTPAVKDNMPKITLFENFGEEKKTKECCELGIIFEKIFAD